MADKNKKTFDVIIVGAGPAGSKAALELSKKGYHTLLIDKAQFPRHKPCGGGMPVKACHLAGLDIASVKEKEINGAYLTFNSRQPAIVKSEGIGVMVCREKFDTLLAGKAAEAGSLLMENCRVHSVDDKREQCTVHTDKGKFTGKVIVGADGAKGVVARKAGLRKERKAGIAIDKIVKVGKKQMDRIGDFAIMDCGVIPYGYTWIFPKRDHLSVGIYTTLKKNKRLEAYLEQFIADQEVLKDCRVVSTHWHPVPLSSKKERLERGRILLAGDAAGLAEPFFGEGIAFALKSASIAAAKIDDFLSGRTKHMKEYSEEIYQSITSDFKYAFMLQNLFYKNPLRSHSVLSKKKFVGKWIASTIKGDISYRGLFMRTLLTVPLWIGSYRE